MIKAFETTENECVRGQLLPGRMFSKRQQTSWSGILFGRLNRSILLRLKISLAIFQ